MSTFLLLLFGLATRCVDAQKRTLDQEIVQDLSIPEDKNRPLRWGDPCTDSCSFITHTRCDNSSNTCVCEHKYPVALHDHRCVKAVLLGNPCREDAECSYHDEHATCRKYTDRITECVCQDEYEMKTIQGLTIPKHCFPSMALITKDIPTFMGLGCGLLLFSITLCMVLRMFARARFVKARRYADANIPPPLTVSETYAAFALSSNVSGRSTPALRRLHPRRSSSQRSLNSISSTRSSRRQSYNSGQYSRPNSRRPSTASLRSAGMPDYYLMYIRVPKTSVSSEASSNFDVSPRIHKSTEQLLAVYAVPELRISPQRFSEKVGGLETATLGPSYTASSLRTLSSEEVFQEEDEDQEEEEETVEDNDTNARLIP